MVLLYTYYLLRISFSASTVAKNLYFQGRFHNNFIASQRPVILRAVEPKFADEVDVKKPSVGVGCDSVLSRDGGTADLCETKDTSSNTSKFY